MHDDMEFVANEWRYDKGGWQRLVAVYWHTKLLRYFEFSIDD